MITWSVILPKIHYGDVIMGALASQITRLAIVYSTVYSDADERKHQSSASLAFVWGIHRDRWIPRTKGQLRGKCFHLMTSSWYVWKYVPLIVAVRPSAKILKPYDFWCESNSMQISLCSHTKTNQLITKCLPWHDGCRAKYQARWQLLWNEIIIQSELRSKKCDVHSLFVTAYALKW